MSNLKPVSDGLGLSFTTNTDEDFSGASRQISGTFRSSASMHGLEQAETGATTVTLDVCRRGNGFQEGQRIGIDYLSPLVEGSEPFVPSEDLPSSDPQTLAVTLDRHGTLLSTNPTQERNAAELKVILGNSNCRLKSGATVLPSSGQSVLSDKVTLEQAKPRARVEVDICLESYVCVQGNNFNGRCKIKIRRRLKKESAILVGDGKVRVVGFECIGTVRRTFYEVSAPLEDVAISPSDLKASLGDMYGDIEPQDGIHIIPFTMRLPLRGQKGDSKGCMGLKGVAVRYIALFSVKIIERETGRRSIAHFYRDCEIWPRFNPSFILAPSELPIQETLSQPVFMGGPDHVTLTASIYRLFWVAGQQCHVEISIENRSKKKIKTVLLSLFRSIVTFKPTPQVDVDTTRSIFQDPDACQTSTSQKKIAESVLENGDVGARCHASARGWWTGVFPGETSTFYHSLLLPPDSLTIPRATFLEVEYSLRVVADAGTFSSELQVVLPIKIINFLSIDPPPMSSVSLRRESTSSTAPSRMSGITENLSHRTPEDLDTSCVDALHPSHEEAEKLDEHEERPDNEDSFLQESIGSSLGSIPLSDADRLVRHAVSSAAIDVKYGIQATRFADLYYNSSEDIDPTDASCNENLTPLKDIEDEIDDFSKTLQSRRRSSFGRRVEEKMAVAIQEGRVSSPVSISHISATSSGHSTCSAVSVSGNFEPSGPNRDSSLDSVLDQTGSVDEQSVQMPTIGVPPKEVASNETIQDRRTSISCTRRHSIGYDAPAEEKRPAPRGRSNTTPGAPRTSEATKAESCTTQPLALGSVKARIKELEERTRMLSDSGPL